MKDIKLECIFSHDYEDIMHFCEKIHFDVEYSLTTRGITKEFPRNTPSILSPGEFLFLKDSRGITWESIEN